MKNNWMNGKLRAAVRDYFMAFLEACGQKKVEKPRDAFVNTDAYPRLQKIPEVEFCVGWLHGVAEAIGLAPEQLFDQLDVEFNKKKARAA